jgi:hypothetical protein
LKINDSNELREADYTIASGIFNVKMENDTENWKEYILTTLRNMNTASKAGFAFNMLTGYHDKEFAKDYLYYADPLEVFDFCKRNFSKFVSLIHDYPLYEFTILIKK